MSRFRAINPAMLCRSCGEKQDLPDDSRLSAIVAAATFFWLQHSRCGKRSPKEK